MENSKIKMYSTELKLKQIIEHDGDCMLIKGFRCKSCPLNGNPIKFSYCGYSEIKLENAKKMLNEITLEKIKKLREVCSNEILKPTVKEIILET